MMKVAIIGIGRWGKNLLREFDKKATVSFCVSQGGVENLAWVKENFPNVKHSKNLEDVLSDEGTEVVVVATPINTHFDIARRALLCGKHVFIEKPAATKISETEELNSLAEKNNKVIFTGFIFLYHDIYRFIKKNLEEMDIEDVSFEWEKMGTFGENIFWNLLSHYISMCVDLFGKPKEIELIQSAGYKTAVDYISLRLHYLNFPSVSISINRYSEKKYKKITLKAEQFSYIWEGDNLHKIDKENTTTILTEKESPLSNEVSNFIDLIEEKKYFYDKVSHDTVEIISELINKTFVGKLDSEAKK